MKRLRLIPLLTAMFLALLVLTSPVSAYEVHKKLIGGVENRTFYINTSTYIFKDPLTDYYRTIDYGSYIRLAVRNWNNAVNKEPTKFGRNANVHFTETSDWSKATIIFNVAEYGKNSGFYGQAFFSKDGASLSTSQGVPSEDYDQATIAINVSTTYAFSNTLLNLATHEFGHAIGLRHWDNQPYTVMHSDIFKSASTPQEDDILGIHKLYSK